MQSVLSMIKDPLVSGGAVLALLTVNAVMDLKTRTVSLSTCMLTGGFGILTAVLQGKGPEKSLFLLEVLLGLMFFYGLSGGGIGLGDIWILMVMALYLQPLEFLLTVSLAVGLSGLFAGMTLKREAGETPLSIPFVPLLLAAYVQIRVG